MSAPLGADPRVDVGEHGHDPRDPVGAEAERPKLRRDVPALREQGDYSQQREDRDRQPACRGVGEAVKVKRSRDLGADRAKGRGARPG